jgi:hypothetical protein
VVLTALGATVAAVLPAAHLALIGSDLYGAPRLYLASAGFAALLGTAVAAVPGRAQPAAGAAILLFHLVALQHNLLIWRDVAATARQTCREASSGFAAPQFPRALDGVPFLLNGYFECVAIERGNAAWLR